jgi:cell division protein FtsN
MTQDFARRRREQAQKQPRYRSNVPGWVWLFTGSVIGAFVMFLVYLAGIAPQSDSDSKSVFSEFFKSKEQSKQPTTTEPPHIVVSEPVEKIDEEKTPKTRFTFYDQLKDKEIVATEKPLATSEAAQQNVQWTLQVASFRNADDADGVRAALILKNMNAWVEKSESRNLETWYRVKVGPFSSSGKRDDAHATLWGMGYQPLTQKQILDRE